MKRFLNDIKEIVIISLPAFIIVSLLTSGFIFYKYKQNEIKPIKTIDYTIYSC